MKPAPSEIVTKSGAAGESGAVSQPAEPADALTSLEGIVLAQVAKADGITAYEVMRVLGRSPTGAVSASPGAVYPVVKRMRERGLIAEESEPRGRREGKGITLTSAGRRALAAWACAITPDDVMPYDPLLSKVAAFGAVPKARRLQALFAARVAIDAKLDEVELALAEGGDIHARPALQGAKALLKGRRAWVEGLLVEIVSD